jgi:cytoskeleton-associated protein 5
LPEIIPDILPALSSKNPQVKEGALKFLGRCFSSASSPIQTGQIKSLSESLAALVEDSHEGARNEAATCMGILMKMVGERPMNAVMDGLADVRKAKVKEAYEKATLKCKLGTGGPPKPSPTIESTKKKVPAKRIDTTATSSTSGLEGEAHSQPKPSAKPPAKPEVSVIYTTS